MVIVIASIHLKPGRVAEYLDIFRVNASEVRKENGCVEYGAATDLPAGIAAQSLDENVVTLVEKWRSLDDLHAHRRAPHMIAYKERVAELVENVRLKILSAADGEG